MTFEELLRLIPESCQTESGAVFNSGKLAFTAPSPLYILGLNPGGDPQKHQDQTVRWNVEKVLTRPDDWSEFRDESWDNKKPGKHKLQRRVLHVLRQLGLDEGRTPASNIIFRRTSAAEHLQGQVDQLASAAWVFHDAVIKALKVKVVLCLGKAAGAWVRSQVAANHLVDEFVEQNNRRWKTQAHSNGRGLTVVTAAHPSWAAWTSPPCDPSPMLRRVFASVDGAPRRTATT